MDIPVGHGVSMHDMVAELAFSLAERAVQDSVSVKAVLESSSKFSSAFEKAASFLGKEFSELSLSPVSSEEIRESARIANQYFGCFEYLEEENILFRPRVNGSGFLPALVADMQVGTSLYEVKTVRRNLSGNDLRQLILYLALQWSSGDRKWETAGFFNPRRGLLFQFSVDHLIYWASGGRSTSDVFHDMTYFLASRNFEVDSQF
ncbi:MAG: hypothetical protein AAFO81_03780 [Pseudomonadota bacterium]